MSSDNHITVEWINAWLVRCVLLIVLAFTIVMVGSAVFAADGKSACPGHYLDGKAPVFVNAAMNTRTIELCSAAFAVRHSGLSRTPLYAAEHLTKDGLFAAEKIVRVDRFHPDPRLAVGDRAELSDYRATGYDRGHMAPAGDMPSDAAQGESFALSNMVPQSPENNRGEWRLIETMARSLAIQDGELFVVSGPLFVGAEVKAIGPNKVLVPTALFKAVYSPAKRWATVYVVRNEPNPQLVMMTLEGFLMAYGVDAFPTLPVDIRQNALMEHPEKK